MDPLNPANRRIVLPALDCDVTDSYRAQIVLQQMHNEWAVQDAACQAEEAAREAAQKAEEAAKDARQQEMRKVWQQDDLEHNMKISTAGDSNFEEYENYKHQSTKWSGKQHLKEQQHSAHLAARDARAHAGYHQQGRDKGPSNRHRPRGGRHKQGESEDAP